MMNSLLGVPLFHPWKEEKKERIKMRRKVSEKHCVSFKDIQPNFPIPLLSSIPLYKSLSLLPLLCLSPSPSPFPRVLYTR